MDAIYTRGLTKYYGKTRGIASLDLQVREGDFYGFIGPNGAGKSTTIRILLGLIRPSGGTAEILGMDIVRDRKRILEKIGYLPSETAFYPSMRVRDVLGFSAALRYRDCRKEAEQLCQRLQLDPSRRVEELSLGNRKKVGIVCALQHLPRLCILDEPTSGLDPLIQREFFSILQERSHQGTTIFLSSHVLSEIQRHCSQAAIIRSGRILAAGTVEDLSRATARRVTVHGAFDPVGLAGIRDLQQTGESVSFLYSGEIRPLLQALSQAPVQDLSIAEPDLEEIFLHYYAEGGTSHDSDPS